MPDLEICVDSVASAVTAELGGANRVELCSALSEGGLTPSLGLLRAVRTKLSIGVHVMIRPRGGNFVYSQEDFAVMKADIALSAEAGADGVVFGLLTVTGEVDVERTRTLVQLARPMEVTFHRAIDVASDPMAALEAIIQSGADRILTSGGEVSASAGQTRIRQLVKVAGKRIRIMAGGSVRAENLTDLINETGANEWHTTARRGVMVPRADSHSDFDLADQMGGADEPDPILRGTVRQLREILDQHVASVSVS